MANLAGCCTLLARLFSDVFGRCMDSWSWLTMSLMTVARSPATYCERCSFDFAFEGDRSREFARPDAILLEAAPRSSCSSASGMML